MFPMSDVADDVKDLSESLKSHSKSGLTMLGLMGI